MRKRNFATRSERMKDISFNSNTGIRHSILRTASVVDEFYFEECTPSDDSMNSVSVCDPIVILFNQQRLDNLGVTAAKSFLDSLAPKSNSLSELRSKCSDEDLMSMVKSRHLQSPAEILSWCRYMQNNIDKFNSEVQKLVEARQAEESAKATQPTETPQSE